MRTLVILLLLVTRRPDRHRRPEERPGAARCGDGAGRPGRDRSRRQDQHDPSSRNRIEGDPQGRRVPVRGVLPARRCELGDDAAGWYRLALWARREQGPGPPARGARSASSSSIPTTAPRGASSGYERVGGEWLTADEAKRKKGFVLAGGKWMLKAEADRLMRHGLMEQAEVTDGAPASRAREIVEALLDDDSRDPRSAAAEMLRRAAGRRAGAAAASGCCTRRTSRRASWR